MPAGAVALYLGLSDANSYNGPPGAYGDNLGTYSAVYSLAQTTVAGTPEPGSLALLGLGLAVFPFVSRFRR